MVTELVAATAEQDRQQASAGSPEEAAAASEHRKAVMQATCRASPKLRAAGVQRFRERFGTEMAERNLESVVAWEGRWVRMKMLVEQYRPDVITVQECDHAAQLAHQLGAMGYSCQMAGGAPHQPAGRTNLTEAEHLQALRDSKLSIYPKWASTALAIGIGQAVSPERLKAATKALTGEPVPARKLRGMLKSEAFHSAGGLKALAELLPEISELDNDGPAIFWRTDRLEPEVIELHESICAVKVG